MKRTAMFHHYAGLAIGFILVLLVACGISTRSSNIPPLPQETLPIPVPSLDANKVNIGRRVYQANCANCHGANAEGAPNWKTPDADFNFPPPPHDDTGHTWHHADKLLFEIIRDGFADPLKPDSPKRMPPFGDKLSDEDIRVVIEYFKSLWSRDSREFQWRVTNNNFQPTQTPSH
ncbi:MAG: cytochrome c [Chloroflexi bacterium]|nr:cytochrome c [Chloroflexota bacterium]